MYDNIDFSLTKDQCSGINLLEDVPQFLSHWSYEGNSPYGKYVRGNLGKLNVSITENRVKIYDSSLCKFYHGNNFKSLTRDDTRLAIEMISDTLHIPFDLATVTRIDFAENMVMEHDEKLYYPYLGESQNYTRSPQKNGLYYANKLRTLIFYGKVHEQKDKKQPIPEFYRDKHLLRFEMRLMKNTAKQLDLPKVTAGMLYEYVFYHNLVTRWHDEYVAIQKIKSRLNDLHPTGRKKEFIEDLALLTIQDIGQPEVLGKINEWQKQCHIEKKQAYDLRSCVKGLSTLTMNENRNDLIAELDLKIKNVVDTAWVSDF